MAPKQRMRIANEKAMKNVTMRGNVPKSSVSFSYLYSQKHIVDNFDKATIISSKINCTDAFDW